MAKIGVVVLLLFLSLYVFPQLGSAQLQQNYYANICPNVETIVRNAVTKKIQETFVTVGATIRLFFHDCFVQVIVCLNIMSKQRIQTNSAFRFTRTDRIECLSDDSGIYTYQTIDVGDRDVMPR